MPGKYWSCQCCKSGQSELWNKIQLMSWSKYHRITIIVTRTIPGRRPDKFCGTWGVLVWYPKKEPQHNSWCPDVGQSLSISPLGFHCWPKPPSSHHRLQNIGLIKTQSNYINLGGSTEHTSQLTSKTWDLRRWELTWCLSCWRQSPSGPRWSSTGEWGPAWSLTGSPRITGDILTSPRPQLLSGGTVRRTSVSWLRRDFYIHIRQSDISGKLFHFLRERRGRGGDWSEGEWKGVKIKSNPPVFTAPVGGSPPGTSTDRVLHLHLPSLHISYQSQINLKCI